jgi:hypothetical protein
MRSCPPWDPRPLASICPACRRSPGNRGPAAAAWPTCVALRAAHPLSVQRFWALETVARIPYFSFISMLHLYETLGWWRAGAELRKVRPPAGQAGRQGGPPGQRDERCSVAQSGCLDPGPLRRGW